MKMSRSLNEELLSLAQLHGAYCLSFYLPMAKTGKEVLQNPTRLKNLIREAKNRLKEEGLIGDVLDEYLRPITALLEDYYFWQHPTDGLAIFLSGNFFKTFSLPSSVKELLVVAKAFHIRPLIQMMAGDRHFYILAISQKSVRFFRSTQFTIQEIQVKNLPHSLSEALKDYEFERVRQMHTSGTGAKVKGDHMGIPHGKGGAKDSLKGELLQFFQQIDKGLHPLLKEEKAPLLVACVDYAFSIYREANTYNGLFPERLVAHPDHFSSVSAEEFRKTAWKKLRPFFDQERLEASSVLKNALGKGAATNDLKEAVKAAREGKIDLCFVAQSEQCWGHLDEETGEVKVLDGKKVSGARDLLDYTIVQTLTHGGKVFPVPYGEVPGRTLVAAHLRF